MSATIAADAPCREVTAQEIAHYREFGWARLPGFVNGDIVSHLLAMGRERMGEDGDSNPPLPITQEFFNIASTDGLNSPVLRPFMNAVGRNARTLMGRRPGIEARYYTDNFAVKLPADKPSKHGGNGRTSFHQDYTNWAVDRSGGMVFWIALTDIAPEAGTMSFLNGSHRHGALGNYRAVDILEEYPELLEHCTLSEPFAYAAGDATVHSNLVAHGAGHNLTDEPRWAWTLLVNPSDVRWDGSPAEGFDTTGMVWLQHMDEERFPILA